MKKLVLTLTLAIAALLSFAQIPQTFSYQGVVRDADNKLVADKQVTVSVQILQGADDGTAVYAETHQVTTNANGLMTFELGSKDAEKFAKIDWSNAPYFVKTVAEFDGKQISGVTPLLAVPYALYAAKAGNADVDLSEYYKKSDVDNLLSELNAKVAKLDKQLNPPIRGKFSVSADKQIYFSQGNLQYQASTGTWRFAENQWDYVGDATYGTVYENEIKCDNGNISETYEGWTDLFSWGASGYEEIYPYKVAQYYKGENDIAGTNYDWGVYNAISNGGNQAGLWRTLTKDEWVYLINTRTDAASKKGFATVNNVTGLVLLPDDWTLPADVTFTSGASGDYAQNTYSSDDWSKMEVNGAVFLPAAGCSDHARVGGLRTQGYYCSSSAKEIGIAYGLLFMKGELRAPSAPYRYTAISVRLVQDAE